MFDVVNGYINMLINLIATPSNFIVGRMEIIISQLMPPLQKRLLRKVDPKFVKALKSSMMRDPTGTGVPPAVVFTNQVSPKDFNANVKDAYK